MLKTLSALFGYFQSEAETSTSGDPRVDAFAGLKFGHRGCRQFRGVTENTQRAFRLAFEHGVDGIELDARLTKDLCPVVSHDDPVQRVFNGQGSVRNQTWDELSTLKTFDQEPESIVTLESVLSWAKDNNLRVLIEIKELARPFEMVRRTIRLMHKYEMLNHAMIITFNPLVSIFTKIIEPRALVCQLAENRWTANLVAKGYEDFDHPNLLAAFSWILDPFLYFISMFLLPFVFGFEFVGPCHKDIDDSVIQFYRNCGIAMYTWTVNDAERDDWLRSRGVCTGSDFLFPKIPEHLRPTIGGGLVDVPPMFDLVEARQQVLLPEIVLGQSPPPNATVNALFSALVTQQVTAAATVSASPATLVPCPTPLSVPPAVEIGSPLPSAGGVAVRAS
jgi:glycerophosphoryl diester phosphodiesterase